MNKKRADQLIFEKGLASSRTLAQEMIKNGEVSFRFSQEKIKKPGQILDEDTEFEIHDVQSAKYVSRAGVKLERALDYLKLNVKGWDALDVGISTGGFTDCLLQREIHRIIGLDVGHDQTHAKLLQSFKVKVFEGVNARELSARPEVTGEFPLAGFDLIVMDVSFISMTLILGEVLPYLKRYGIFLGLVKPQFEVGPHGLGKGGIVKNTDLFLDVEQKIRRSMQELKMNVVDYFPSGLEGKDGNQEFFIFATSAG